MSRYVIYESIHGATTNLTNSSLSGYATNETTEMIPIPEMLTNRFLNLMNSHPSVMFFRNCHDAQVVFDYDTGKIVRFTAWIAHTHNCSVEDFAHLVIALMNLVASEYGFNTDFEMIVSDLHLTNARLKKHADDVAKSIILKGYADRCKVKISYINSNYKPLVELNCYGTEYMNTGLILKYANEKVTALVNGGNIDEANEN